ncbi:50S ribosomal protein L22 [Actinobacteria bacterium YIM 96077]|uniref:Large ribosomal subunit protein uL22 n=1 Tax=Phytoactinopolyspora halophila TaxID=1981511 RepID=A0A329QB65_9ACTN|nr:50S ribosomal protein L22 [Phytoactinopolyspora halophila]AYY14740.1 50S ribosomal protein L22 [Actinobacteria bacterium YIM 96077]RAW09650.1 50S ribosomal protein L22 [Phytoactinopolyspora halophila]
MEAARAQARFVRVAPTKARRVVDLIRGLDVDEASALLQFTPSAAAEPVRKTLESAVANAYDLTGTQRDTLKVGTAYVDEGPTLKRFRPGGKGRAFRIKKRTCHITIVVADKQSANGAPASARTRASAGAGGAKGGAR